jgi:hypothetical protein
MHHIPWVMEKSEHTKDKAPPKYPDAKAKEKALINAVGNAEGIEELQANAAAGDEDAMRMLVTFLHEVVDWLTGVSCRQPELVAKIASQRFAWPVLLARHPGFARETNGFLKRIQLGEACPYYSKSNQWGIGWGGKISVATLWAEGIHATIEANRSHLRIAKRLGRNNELKAEWKKIPQWAKDCLTLKPLTRDTAPQWFEVGWQAILDETNGKPESVPELRALGEHRAQHSEHSGQQKRTTPRTAAVNIRARIKERIAQALHGLAPSR